MIRFFRLPPDERLLMTEALIIQLWLGILIKLIPFRWIPKIFSNPKNTNLGTENHESPDANNNKKEQRITFLLKEAIRRSSGLTPWQNKCLVSSLTARCMLRRRKIESRIFLGVTKNSEDKLIAHAWLDTNYGEIVASGGNYHRLYQF